MRDHCVVCESSRSRLLFIKDRQEIVECTSCRTVYQKNPPSPDKMRDLYNGHYSGREERADLSIYVKTDYFRIYEGEQHLKKVSNVKDLLDVGCGPGFFLQAASRKYIDAVGIDISDKALEYARSIGLDVMVGDLLSVDIPEKSKDMITFWASIEHLHNPKEVLKKAHKILRDDGQMIIETM